MRIATLLPSATEIVGALGLSDQLVGVSHSCRLPQNAKGLPRLTSTHVPLEAPSAVIDRHVRDHLDSNTALYDLDMKALNRAAPDLIVSQALCDVCAVSTGDVLEALRSLPSRPVLIDLTPNTLGDVLDDCLRVGSATGRADQAERLVAELQRRIEAVASSTTRISDSDRPGVAFLEWLDPPFNGGHWNPEIVDLAGGNDLLGTHALASKTISWDSVAESDPDVVFIACCGYPLERTLEDVRNLARHRQWRDLRAVETGRVYIADGVDHFACPGPRLVDSLEIMAHALHPEFHPNLHPASMVVAPQTFSGRAMPPTASSTGR